MDFANIECGFTTFKYFELDKYVVCGSFVGHLRALFTNP